MERLGLVAEGLGLRGACWVGGGVEVKRVGLDKEVKKIGLGILTIIGAGGRTGSAATSAYVGGGARSSMSVSSASLAQDVLRSDEGATGAVSGGGAIGLGARGINLGVAGAGRGWGCPLEAIVGKGAGLEGTRVKRILSWTSVRGGGVLEEMIQ